MVATERRGALPGAGGWVGRPGSSLTYPQTALSVAEMGRQGTRKDTWTGALADLIPGSSGRKRVVGA